MSGKARVRPGWQVYWPPGHLLKPGEKQRLYDEGQIVEFEGDVPQIAALEVLPEEEDVGVKDEKKDLEKPPADKMVRPGKKGPQSVVKK